MPENRRLAHRLLNCFAVNDDCRLTDCRSQCWPRRRYKALPLRCFGAVVGTTSTNACASLFPFERDCVIRGATAELVASADGVGSGTPARTAYFALHRRGFCCRRFFHPSENKGNCNGLSRAFGIRHQDGGCRRIQDLHVDAGHDHPRLYGRSDPGTGRGLRGHRQRLIPACRSSAPRCFRSDSACCICSASIF